MQREKGQTRDGSHQNDVILSLGAFLPRNQHQHNISV